MQSRCARAVTEFLKRTNLHGFKYLTSYYYCDRVFWTLVCFVSTCCAGGLCAELWARFLHRPALMTVQQLREDHLTNIPLVICPPPELITENLFGLNESSPDTRSLSSMLQYVITKRPLREGQALDQWLQENQTSLAEALVNSSPECGELLTFCRWQYKRMPCQELFYKELTEWGACCVLNRTMLRPASRQLEMTSWLDLVLRCSNTFTDNGCMMYTAYEGEDGVDPMELHQGLEYAAELIFTVTESSEERLDTGGECVKERGYSKDLCGLKCLEILCGCSHPLLPVDVDYLPECSVAQISCLQSDHHFHDNESCTCPPSCTAYVTELTLESSPMDSIQHAPDPLYAGLDTSTTIVLRVRLRHASSKMIALLPTESWLSLLSSLGGVFNMFLGVGVFSALEFIFLILVKLPMATQTSTEINDINVPTRLVVRNKQSVPLHCSSWTTTGSHSRRRL